ncbi:hypothetical protein JGI1_00537 [Candidatus Thermokryptus mobilis]|uniref:DNA-binding protein n=1 Tax=Candidatus Thermokryptus mobilis TaxID=1643428 RepID=A0A0S4MXF0_9BACT|nr:LOG family protein [Candidatus Thermokryptus mobilis]CUU02614.1 hypothetical protein JGI1_00537 [Candidatus Thermokryptus mobilis]
MIEKVITIFGSSKPVEGDEEYEFARKLGLELGRAGFTICNGGYGGTMEATARGAKESGAKTIGVTIATLNASANKWIDDEIKARDLFERLKILIEKGDAYVVLRGGTGTLVELSLAWELINKNFISRKPLIAVSFWTPIIQTISKQLLSEGSIEGASLVRIIDSVDEIVEHIKNALAIGNKQ